MKKLVLTLLFLGILGSAIARDVVITIPDDKVQLVVEAFCEMYGYSEQIEGKEGNTISNPVSKEEFTRRKIIEFIKRIVKK